MHTHLRLVLTSQMTDHSVHFVLKLISCDLNIIVVVFFDLVNVNVMLEDSIPLWWGYLHDCIVLTIVQVSVINRLLSVEANFVVFVELLLRLLNVMLICILLHSRLHNVRRCLASGLNRINLVVLNILSCWILWLRIVRLDHVLRSLMLDWRWTVFFFLTFAFETENHLVIDLVC